MIKTRDVPTELKPFNSVFNDLIYRHDVSRVFDDFLTIVICAMAYQTQEELYLQTIKNYSRKELDLFAQLFAQLIIIYSSAKDEKQWTDPLGTYYEVLAGNYKKSRLGQFFTPAPLCEIMSAFIIDKDDFGKTINEPTCGSGRIILAANQHCKGNYYVAQDLDPICCKMTAINLCFHEIRAEIHCMNTLAMTPPTRSYFTNNEFWKHQIKHILVQ